MNLLAEPDEYLLPVIAMSELIRFGVQERSLRLVIAQSGCAVLLNGEPVFGTLCADMVSERLQQVVQTWGQIAAADRAHVYEQRWQSTYSAALATALTGISLADPPPQGAV